MEKEKYKSRKKCPFYGFHYEMGIMIDSSGNQCALVTESLSPCRMEYPNKREVDWNNCPLNREQESFGLKNLLEDSIVFPDESSAPHGIPFREWYKIVMKED